MDLKDKDSSAAAPHVPKMDCFEGLRGLASLGVLAGHLIIAFWPILYASGHPQQAMYPKIVRWFCSSPTRILFDAQFAVSMFFLLSGFVLSLSFFRSGSIESLSSAAVRRYFRLMIPAGFSIMVGYCVLKAGWMQNHAAVAYMDQSLGFTHWWLGLFYQFGPSFTDALRESFWDTFFGAGAMYNQNLWTMSIELAGSFVVYGFLSLFGKLRNRGVCYAVVSGLLLLSNRTYMLNFVAGMFLCDLYVANMTRRKPFQLSTLFAVGLALVAVYINFKKKGGYSTVWSLEISRSFVSELISGFLLVGTVAFSSALRRFFARRTFVFLGKISFALYLIHLILICSLASGVYLALARNLGASHNWAAIVASLVCAGVSIGVSWFMYLYIDAPTMNLGKSMFDRFFKATTDAGKRTYEPTISLPLSRAA